MLLIILPLTSRAKIDGSAHGCGTYRLIVSITNVLESIYHARQRRVKQSIVYDLSMYMCVSMSVYLYAINDDYTSETEVTYR